MVKTVLLQIQDTLFSNANMKRSKKIKHVNKTWASIYKIHEMKMPSNTFALCKNVKLLKVMLSFLEIKS